MFTDTEHQMMAKAFGSVSYTSEEINYHCRKDYFYRRLITTSSDLSVLHILNRIYIEQHIQMGKFYFLSTLHTFMTSSLSSSQRTNTLLPADNGREVDRVTASWASRLVRAGLLLSPAVLMLFS